jgi:hypothetical protein
MQNSPNAPTPMRPMPDFRAETSHDTVEGGKFALVMVSSVVLGAAAGHGGNENAAPRRHHFDNNDRPVPLL